MAMIDQRQLEEGSAFTPRFDRDGLIVCITVDVATRAVLMVAYMNEAALRATRETGIAHYWSRSRGTLWRKGDTSGQVQTVAAMFVDCDQDAILLHVAVAGDGRACHTGRYSCFYRKLDGERLTVCGDDQHREPLTMYAEPSLKNVRRN